MRKSADSGGLADPISGKSMRYYHSMTRRLIGSDGQFGGAIVSGNCQGSQAAMSGWRGLWSIGSMMVGGSVVLGFIIPFYHRIRRSVSPIETFNFLQ